ncbi:uncharacterized protein LOC116610147 [Nematostella vectensis]|uniref:uncharacterized protein LOC116610147 n=1 Tax=Nematostella vectensis TaxID=45351 RepID=UPI0013905F10|nr:uncharacterized protein LOC116610147 [Nematostella vectensis]
MWLRDLFVLIVIAVACVTAAAWPALLDDEPNVAADYLGCYKDDKAPLTYWHNNIQDRSLAYPIKNYFGSVKKCVDACADKFYPYAGLQAGFLCFCGTDFNKYGRLDDNFCNIKCRGNHISTKHLQRTKHGEFWLDCGGKWANSIYSTYGLLQQEHRIAEAKMDDSWLWNRKK